MGTNYFVTSEPPCPHCGRGGEKLHIGKSSAGWVFTLHVIPEQGINSLDDWKAFWQDKKITDEYDNEITEENMLSVITNRKRNKTELTHWGYNSASEMLERNHAIWLPEWGLLRSRLVHGCVGYGEGTWDLHEGEFS